uniref:NADH-ubiquinone oxidoreductase chain 2 n=1 Tax=Dryadomorpha sp. EMHAU-2015-Zz060407 TaxID=2037761 RepID=A0A343K1X5_9HEMI|nr:NADH dehydrogenase subunit 2 [Dryadomorpha sp. EMHAU-2015-Zz060407]
MLFNSTKLVLTNTMMIGVIMVICSNNWMSMWMGLEMSMLSLIPMMQTNKLMSTESMIKYFIVQSIASTMMLLSILIMLIGVSMIKTSMLMILTSSMLIKIGSAPFHNWILMVIETLNYNEMWIMLTWIKIPPITILYQINTKFMTMPILLGMIYSSVSCLNQTSMRKTLGYSSIFNMALVLSAIENFNMIMIFMLLYTIMLWFMSKILETTKTNFINQMVFNEKQPIMKLNIWMNMLSMGGFPPMMGFFNKLMIMQMMIKNNQFMILLVLILTSMFVMMFYIRLAFTSMIVVSSCMKWVIYSKNQLFMLLFNFIVFPIMISMTMVF